MVMLKVGPGDFTYRCETYNAHFSMSTGTEEVSASSDAGCEIRQGD